MITSFSLRKLTWSDSQVQERKKEKKKEKKWREAHKNDISRPETNKISSIGCFGESHLFVSFERTLTITLSPELSFRANSRAILGRFFQRPALLDGHDSVPGLRRNLAYDTWEAFSLLATKSIFVLCCFAFENKILRYSI